MGFGVPEGGITRSAIIGKGSSLELIIRTTPYVQFIFVQYQHHLGLKVQRQLLHLCTSRQSA